MMHGRGKSDTAVVAVKPANKAERPAAELGEPRAGTEGNANQQSTGRTQRRETVSQVLARIRQAARQRKKERFTATVAGYFRYHAVPTNSPALVQFRDGVTHRWRQLLSRRSQKGDQTWTRIAMFVDYWLPRPRILHPWPNQRFAVRHPR